MNILLFPEGTTSDGRSLLPFKSAPFQASVDTGAPVVPFVISYRTPDVAWYGDMGFRRHIWDLLSNDTLEADIRTLQPIFPENLDRKELASLVHERMKPYMPGGNNSTEVFPSA
jgi:1-acyl-sn-glycerol-3-phosphate acyltransferase